MKQTTDAWHAWRQQGLGGSDAGIILGVSPWSTPYRLWHEKKGLWAPRPQTAIQAAGLALEDEARRAYEAHTGIHMEPCTKEWADWPVMRGSLDGLSFDGDVALEIKCPGARDHATVAEHDDVPAKYIPQVQHLLVVSGAKELHYWSYRDGAGLLVKVHPDTAYQERLVAAERAFWALVQGDEPPPFAGADRVTRADATWIALAEDYRHCEAVVAEWTTKKDAVRQALLEAADGVPQVEGGGIQLTRSAVTGSVDYAALVKAKLPGEPLEPWRKAGREQVRITIQKGSR